MSLDQNIFHLLNSVLIHPWLDFSMPYITNQKFWLPFLVAIWFWLLIGRNGANRRLAVLLVLIVVGADQMSSAVIKPLVGRKRPCCSETDPRMLIPCKTSKSFPSSHAANTAGVAGVVWLVAGWKYGLPVWLIALTVGYSRIYVGVHYPLDVVAGHALGWILAMLIVALSNKWFLKPDEKCAATNEKSLASNDGKHPA